MARKKPVKAPVAVIERKVTLRVQDPQRDYEMVMVQDDDGGFVLDYGCRRSFGSTTAAEAISQLRLHYQDQGYYGSDEDDDEWGLPRWRLTHRMIDVLERAAVKVGWLKAVAKKAAKKKARR